MPSVNKVFLMGNLTRTPELRYTPSGAAICEFGMAINRTYVSNNVKKEEVTFIDVNVWQRQGELCQRRLQKGSLVMVEGRLKTDQWVDKESGKNRSRVLVVAERVNFVASLPRTEDSQDYDSEAGQQRGRSAGGQRSQYAQRDGGGDRRAGTSSGGTNPPPPPEPEYDEPVSDDDGGENVPF